MISICCVFYKDLEGLDRYVQSLIKNTRNPFELVIYCNTEDAVVRNKFLQKVHEWGNAVKVNTFVSDVNKGMGIGVQWTVATAVDNPECDYIVTSDTDLTVLTPGWDEKMMKLLQHLEVGYVCTPKNAGQTWRIRRPNYLEVDVAIGCFNMTRRDVIKAIRKKLDGERSRLTGRIDSCMFHTDNEMYTRYLQKVKQFVIDNNNHVDAGYFYGVLDFDSSLLIRWAGYRIAIAEDIDIYHKDSTISSEFTPIRKKLTHEAWNYYRCKFDILFDWVEWTGRIDLWDSIPLNLKFQKECKVHDTKL